MSFCRDNMKLFSLFAILHLLAGCGGSLTKSTQLVFVPSGAAVDGVEVKYENGQHFKISRSPFDSTVRVLPQWDGRKKYTLIFIARVDEEASLDTDSFDIRLTDSNGSTIALTASQEPVIHADKTTKRVSMWSQRFCISAVTAESHATMIMHLDAAYTDDTGNKNNINAAIPLVQKQITITSPL